MCHPPAVPEGDTIFRTAATLHRWLHGRRITGARSRGDAVAVGVLVGATVLGAEARGKHLLIRFEADEGPPLVLRSHMRMTGSWHVYAAGAPWPRPERQATLVLEAGERTAVGFNVPVVELTTERDVPRVRAIASLGPDVLVEPFDVDEVRRRAAGSDPGRPIGDLLLDQRVVAGIGNIYRCESLFQCGLHPWTPLSAIDAAVFDGLLLEASRLMRANVGAASPARGFGAGPDRPWVYGRSARPCRRCATRICSQRLGGQARTVYWCPVCQPA